MNTLKHANRCTVFLNSAFNTVKYMCICTCKLVWTDVGLEADCPKAGQVLVTPLHIISVPCLDCCLRRNVTVLLTPRGECFCCVFCMLSKYKPEERKKNVEGNGKNTFTKQDFGNSLLFLEVSIPPPEHTLICNSKIF